MLAEETDLNLFVIMNKDSFVEVLGVFVLRCKDNQMKRIHCPLQRCLTVYCHLIQPSLSSV
jgi:hypothetical protein